MERCTQVMTCVMGKCIHQDIKLHLKVILISQTVCFMSHNNELST